MVKTTNFSHICSFLTIKNDFNSLFWTPFCFPVSVCLCFTLEAAVNLNTDTHCSVTGAFIPLTIVVIHYLHYVYYYNMPLCVCVCVCVGWCQTEKSIHDEVSTHHAAEKEGLVWWVWPKIRKMYHSASLAALSVWMETGRGQLCCSNGEKLVRGDSEWEWVRGKARTWLSVRCGWLLIRPAKKKKKVWKWKRVCLVWLVQIRALQMLADWRKREEDGGEEDVQRAKSSVRLAAGDAGGGG